MSVGQASRKQLQRLSILIAALGDIALGRCLRESRHQIAFLQRHGGFGARGIQTCIEGSHRVVCVAKIQLQRGEPAVVRHQSRKLHVGAALVDDVAHTLVEMPGFGQLAQSAMRVGKALEGFQESWRIRSKGFLTEVDGSLRDVQGFVRPAARI